MAAAGWKMAGICGCCPECQIAADAFERATLGGDWTEELGSWTLPTEHYVATADSPALLIHNTPHPDGDDHAQVIQVRFLLDEYGDQARFCLGLDDVDNYVFAEVTIVDPGCGELRFFVRSGGTDTQVGDTQLLGEMALDAWHDAQVCLWYDEETESWQLDAFGFRQAIAPSVVGDQVALGTSTLTGTAQFDDFFFLYHGSERSGCPRCRTAPCIIDDDTFTRTDSDNPGCLWEEIEGDWDVDDSELVTSDADAVLKNLARHPRDLTTVTVELDFKVATSGQSALVYLGYEDDANFASVAITVNSSECSTISIRQLPAGFGPPFDFGELRGNYDAKIPTGGLATGEWNHLKLCYSIGDDLFPRLVVLVTNPAGDTFAHHARDASFASVVEPHVCLGTGGGSGEVRFDNFVLRQHTDAEIECDSCGYGDCRIFEDDFDDDEISCVWEETGDWTEVGSTISIDGAGRLLCLAGHPGVNSQNKHDHSQSVEVQFRSSDYGDSLSVLVDYTLWADDSESYYYAIVTLNADSETEGTLEIHKHEFGDDDLLASVDVSLPPDTDLTLRVCFQPTLLKAVVVGRASVEEQGFTPNFGQRVAIDADTSGTLEIDRFDYHTNIADEPCLDCQSVETCDVCEDSQAPALTKARIRGILGTADWYDRAPDYYERTVLLPGPGCSPIDEADYRLCSVMGDENIGGESVGWGLIVFHGALSVRLWHEAGTDNWHATAFLVQSFGPFGGTASLKVIWTTIWKISATPPDCFDINLDIPFYQLCKTGTPDYDTFDFDWTQSILHLELVE